MVYLLMLFMIVAGPVWALNISTPEWTGISAEKIDGGYYPDFTKSVSPLKTNYASTAGYKDGGQGFQFKVNQPTHIDYLLVDAKADVFFWPKQEIYTWKVNLYEGDGHFRPSLYPPGEAPIIPDVNKQILSSDIFLTNQPHIIKTDFGDYTEYVEKDYKDYVVPFSADLGAGNYWVTAEDHFWTDGAASYSNLRFASNDKPGAVTPEPSTYLLILLGFGLVFRKQARRLLRIRPL